MITLRTTPAAWSQESIASSMRSKRRSQPTTCAALVLQVLLVEEAAQRALVDVVGLVLDLAHGDGLLHATLVRLVVGQVVEHVPELPAGCQSQRRHLLGLDARAAHVEEVEADRDRLHAIHDVIEAQRQVADVVAVKGRDKGGVELLHDATDMRVASVLVHLHQGNHARRLGVAVHELVVVLCAGHDIDAELLEHRVERVFLLDACHVGSFDKTDGGDVPPMLAV